MVQPFETVTADQLASAMKRWRNDEISTLRYELDEMRAIQAATVERAEKAEAEVAELKVQNADDSAWIDQLGTKLDRERTRADQAENKAQQYSLEASLADHRLEATMAALDASRADERRAAAEAHAWLDTSVKGSETMMELQFELESATQRADKAEARAAAWWEAAKYFVRARDGRARQSSQYLGAFLRVDAKLYHLQKALRELADDRN